MAFKLLVILTVLKLTLSNPYPGINVEIDIHVDNSETKVKEEISDDENDDECVDSQCPQTSISRMAGNCKDTFAAARTAIVKELIENANQYQTTVQSTPATSTPGTSNMNQNIFNAIKPIVFHQDLATDDLIEITNFNLLKHLELNDPSYITMKKIRKAWTLGTTAETELNDFKKQIENVAAIKARKMSADSLFKYPETLKHIFEGAKDEKIDGNFVGLHDGSVFYNLNEQGESEVVVGAHNITGGTVLKVCNIGPGVVVKIENPIIAWRGDTEELTKKHTDIFLGVPPRFQAALYLTAFLEDPKRGCTTVTVINPEHPFQKLLSITVANWRKPVGIKAGFPSCE